MGALIPFRDGGHPLERIARGEVVTRDPPPPDWRRPDGGPMDLASLTAHYAAVRARMAAPVRLADRAAEARKALSAAWGVLDMAHEVVAEAEDALRDAGGDPLVAAPSAFDHRLGERPLPIERAIAAVAQVFGVTRIDLRSSRRTAKVVLPRQIAMWLMKTFSTRSLPEIGRRMGGRDHTTVLHAVRKIERLIATDEKIAEQVEACRKLAIEGNGRAAQEAELAPPEAEAVGATA